MLASVNKLKEQFLSHIEDIYNYDHYLIKSCLKFPSKYSADRAALDEQLRIFFEENNKIVLGGHCLKYCDRDGERKHIKIADISDQINQPDINIINNYIVEDKWDKNEW